MDDTLPKPCVLPADHARGSDKGRKSIEARNVVRVVPRRKFRTHRAAVGRKLSRMRSLVERCLNKPGNACGVATRHDKTAEGFPGIIDITSIRLWLNLSST